MLRSASRVAARALAARQLAASARAAATAWRPLPTPRPTAGFPPTRPRHAAALSDDEAAPATPRGGAAHLGVSIGFLGAGAMGEALLRGFLNAGCVLPSEISASVRSQGRKTALAALGVDSLHGDALHGGAAEVAAASDVIIVAVKPSAFRDVLTALAPAIDTDRHLVISIAAGVTTAAMEAALPASTRVVRVMPNTPCLVGAGASVFARGEAATDTDAALVLKMLSSVGVALELEEKLMDAATGLSGCGPAFVLLAIEALADGGVREGLPRDAAITLAAHTVAGAAKLVTDAPSDGRVPTHPALLREAVCSPGGATIVGLAQLEDAGVRGALARAVGAAAARARELA